MFGVVLWGRRVEERQRAAASQLRLYGWLLWLWEQGGQVWGRDW